MIRKPQQLREAYSNWVFVKKKKKNAEQKKRYFYNKIGKNPHSSFHGIFIHAETEEAYICTQSMIQYTI